MLFQVRRCSGIVFLPGCTCAGSRDIWVSNAAPYPWYPTLCEGYGKDWWTLARLGPFLAAAWSILCIHPHSFWQGSTAPWWHHGMNSRWVRLKIVSWYFHPSAHSRFPTSPWRGGLLWEEWKQSFPDVKIHEQKNNRPIDLTIYLRHLCLFDPQIWEYQN